MLFVFFCFVLTDSILLNLDLQKRTPDLDNFSTAYTFACYLCTKYPKIRDIFFIKGLIIGFLGTAFDSFIAITLAILQNNFKLIGVPEDIYFMNFIPVDINYFQVLVISIITLIVSSLVSIWPAIRSTKILPSQALKYE